MKVIPSSLIVAIALASWACSDNAANPSPTTSGSSSSAGGAGGTGTTSSTTTTTGGGSSQATTSGTAGSGLTTSSGTAGSGGSGGASTSGSAGNGGSGGSAGTVDGGSGGSAGGAVDAGGPDAPAWTRFVCPAGPFPTPMAGGSQTVCQGFKYNHGYNEGAAWIARINAFVFSNFVQGSAGGIITGDIIKYTPGGACEIFIADVGTNGLAVSPDGNIIGACHKTRSITEFDVVTKQPKVLVDMYMNKMLDSPNDLAVHSNGGVYFSNPTYELGPNRQQGFGPAMFWMNPAGMLTVLFQGGAPNGVLLSADEKRLYVVGGGLWDIDPSGTPSNKRNFDLGNADGLAADCAGNVYSSGGTIMSAAGQQVGTFPGGTNLTFGGADGKTLIVVGGGTSVHTVQMNVPGVP